MSTRGTANIASAEWHAVEAMRYAGARAELLRRPVGSAQQAKHCLRLAGECEQQIKALAGAVEFLLRIEAGQSERERRSATLDGKLQSCGALPAAPAATQPRWRVKKPRRVTHPELIARLTRSLSERAKHR